MTEPHKEARHANEKKGESNDKKKEVRKKDNDSIKASRKEIRRVFSEVNPGESAGMFNDRSKFALNYLNNIILGKRTGSSRS